MTFAEMIIQQTEVVESALALLDSTSDGLAADTAEARAARREKVRRCLWTQFLRDERVTGLMIQAADIIAHAVAEHDAIFRRIDRKNRSSLRRNGATSVEIEAIDATNRDIARSSRAELTRKIWMLALCDFPDADEKQKEPAA